MKKRKYIYQTFYLIGFAVYAIFLTKLSEISIEAWLYGWLSAIGAFIFASAICARNDEDE